MIARNAYESLLRFNLPEYSIQKKYKCLVFSFRVSLLQPTSPKFQDFAEQVRERAASVYNYTFSEHEEVLTVSHRACQISRSPNTRKSNCVSSFCRKYENLNDKNERNEKNRSISSSELFTMAFIYWDWC